MIILFGVVGSGKSEQALRLITKLSCQQISTSDLIRQQSNPEWEKQIMAGRLLPDEEVLPLIEAELKKIDAAHNEFILDGAPRSIGQAEWLVNKIKAGGLKLTAIFHLKVSRETTLKRLLARGREDDKAEIIVERFRQYEEITSPVLDYLRSQGYEISDLDGEWSADVVEKQIWQVLGDKLSAPQIR